MNAKIELEKCLKRFVKGKKIGFSLAALVFLLINGNLGYAEDFIPTREQLDQSITKTLERVDEAIKKNNKSVEDAELDIELLLRQGRFFTKPLSLSNQFFWSFYGHNRSENRDKTHYNFNEVEYFNPYYQGITSEDGVLLPNISSFGIVKRPVVYADEISFGANIKPKTVKEKNVDIHVDSKFKKIKLNIPKVSTPGAITPPAANFVKINLERPTLPQEVNVNIAQNIQPIEKIEIGSSDVKAQKITPATISPITITPPNPQFSMKTIGEVGAPELPQIVLPEVFIPFTLAGWVYPINVYSYWCQNNGVLSNLSMKDGEVTLEDFEYEKDSDGKIKKDKDSNPIIKKQSTITGKKIVAEIFRDKKSISDFKPIYKFEDTTAEKGSIDFNTNPVSDSIPQELSGENFQTIDLPEAGYISHPNFTRELKFFDVITNAPFIHINNGVKIVSNISNMNNRPDKGVFFYYAYGPVYLGANLNYPYRELYHNGGLEEVYTQFAKLEDYKEDLDSYFHENSSTKTSEDFIKELRSYQNYSGIIGNRQNPDSDWNKNPNISEKLKNKKEDFLFVNNGEVTVNGKFYSYLMRQDGDLGGNRTGYLVNDKDSKININGELSLAYSFSTTAASGTNRDATHNIVVNYGNININGEKAAGVVTGGGRQTNTENGFFNVGTGRINVNGINAVGISYSYENQWAKSDFDYIGKNSLVYIKSPIVVTGDNGVGFISTNNGPGAGNEKNVLNIELGGKAPEEFGEVTDAIKSKRPELNGKDFENGKVDYAVGIYEGQNRFFLFFDRMMGFEYPNPTHTKTAAVVNIKDKTNQNIGVYAKHGKISIIKHIKSDAIEADETFDSEVNIIGGEKNIALLAKNGYRFHQPEFNSDGSDRTFFNDDGIIDFTGNINVTGGKDHRVIVSSGKIDIDGDIKIGIDDSNRLEGIKAFYAFSKPNTNVPDHISGIINVKQGKNMHLYLGDNSIGVISDNGRVTFDGGDYNRETNSDILPNISLKLSNENNSDVGLYAGNGGQIKGENLKYEFINPLVGVSSDGKNDKNENSDITLNGSEVTYKGKGYAFQTKDGGTIHFENGVLNIDGSASLTKLDITSPDQALFMNGSKINVKSNDVSLFYLNNQSTPLNTSNLAGTILGKVGITVSETNPITDIIKYTDAPLYTFLTMNGGHIVVDSTVDRNNPDDIFGSRTKIQKSIIDIGVNGNPGTISAVVDENRGRGILNDNIVGMAISSADGANSKNDTQINLGADGKIIAKKNYASSIGAIGAYINFGKVDNKGVIQVEKDSTNLQGIGIFATNGSEITNSGTVETGGLKGIGIYTTALREEGGSVVKDEFKDGNNHAVLGQGTLNITNSGTITVGSGGIGIYAKNNGDKPAQDNIVTNTKNIIVGYSDDSPSVGILGDKVTIVNKDVAGNSNGTVQVGKKGIGIYATNHTDIKNPGTVALSDGSIGIKVDSTSSIETSDPVKLVNSSGNNLVENTIGVFFDTVANLPSALKVDMSDSNFKSSTLYTGGKSGETIVLESNINISGQNNAGITVSKDVNLTYNGVITVETKNPDDKGNIGIVGVDGNTVDTKSSTFNLNGEGGTGVYVINSNTSKLKVSGSTINLNGKDNSGITVDKSEFSVNTQLPTINFAANSGSEIKNNKGIYAINGSTINMDKVLNLTIPEGAGIFAHLENSAINVKEDFTLNGGVGIYAEKDGTVSVDSGKNIAVNSGGIGIKSGSEGKDDSNTINLNGDIVVSGQKSIGLYSDNLTVLNGDGKFDIKNKGVGIYLNSGHIKVQEMKLDIDDATTGIYVTESSQLGEDGNSAKVVITNKNNGVNGVGIFFVNDDPTNTTEISDNDNLELNGNNITGRYYSSKSYRLENGNTVLNGKDYIGNYLESESEIAANGTVSSNNGDKNIAYYVDKGKLSILTGGAINITDNNGTSGTESVGVVIKGEGNKNRGIVDNDGVITITGDGIGIYASDSNYTVNNRGSVVAKSDGNIRAAGIYLKGTNNSTDDSNAIEFYNSGIVKADDLAIYLENIGEKDRTVNRDKSGNTQGKLVLTGEDSMGVFAKNSYITFNPGEVERTSSGKIKALVAATDNSTFALGTLNLKNNEGVALIADEEIKFIPGSEIVVDSNNSVGMVAYNWLAPAKTVENVKITSNGDSGAGIYITQDSGNSSDIIINSTVVQNGDGGTGVYISKDAKVTTGADSEIVVNRGIGYYIAGELDAQSGKINTSDDGTAFFVDEGILNLGSGYQISGSGILVSGKNYSSEVSNDMNVPKIGVVGEYDKDSTVDKKLAINNGATMTLTKDDAVGIYGSVNPTDAPDHHIANVDVTLENRGTIGFATGVKKTIGIYGKGTDILNSGIIDVSSDGYGIFATNKDSKADTLISNSNEIKLNGNGTGIYLSELNTTKDVTVGKITSTGDSNKGVYVKDAAGSAKLKDADIEINDNSQGIIVNNSRFGVENGKIAISSSSSDENAKSVGVFTKDGVGSIENTLIDAGTNGIGLYAIGASGDVKIDLGDGITKGIKLGENTKSIVGIVAQEGSAGIKGNLYTNSGVGIDISDNGQLRMDDTATVKVNGVKGLGLELVNGRIVNLDKLRVEVITSDAQGIYVSGSVNGSPSNTILPVVNLHADDTKAYIFENTDTALEISQQMVLNKKDQIGVLTKGHGTQPVTVNGLAVLEISMLERQQ